jgi:DNA polymerase I
MNKNKKNIFLIDGNSICYRAYYAIQGLSTSKGVATNAVYGFISMIRKVIRDHAPDKMIMVFDMPGETTRHEKYEDYKIHRAPMPDDLRDQLPKIKEVTKAYNIPICQKQGYEADDIIATIAKNAEKRGLEVVIVTADKDALQLIDHGIKVLSPHTMGDKVYDSEAVREKFGVYPELMVELMALMGDSSDNIPGVKGIGKVTAAKLINKYGSVEGVYRHLEEISSISLRRKLEEGRDMAVLSRELVELEKDVPVEIVLDDAQGMPEPDLPRLKALFKELEFGKLLREISPSEGSVAKTFAALSGKEAVESLSEIKSIKLVAMSLDPGDQDGSPVEGISFSWEDKPPVYVAFPGDEQSDGEIKRLLYDILESDQIKKIGHGLKDDIRLLRRSGVELGGIWFDVMIADYLVDPSMAKYSLEDIAIRKIGYNISHVSKETSWGEGGQAEMLVSCSDGSAGACERCDAIFGLYKVLDTELDEKRLKPLFRDVEMSLVKVIADMEENGVGIDMECLKEGAAAVDGRLMEASKKIYELAGEEFNINSPKQLQHILYEKLALPAGKRTKTGRSTDESVLNKLASMHELPRILLEYREMNKLKTAYYDSILQMADKKDGRLHARFNQAVTSTGRLSSSEPNLQNIPIKTEVGREIRRAFVPRSPKMVLLAADYSQVELRVLAHLSGDENLIKAFREGKDVHRFTASLVYGCPVEEVTEKMRAAAKTVNFGIIYGMSSFGLAKDLDISVEEAGRFISSYFERYAGVSEFIEKTIEKVKKTGYVTTLLKRRRYIPEIKSVNERARSFAERAAVNTAVQGTAADIIKLAMIKCHDTFAGTETRMIIQVHDELVFDTPSAGIKGTAGKVKAIMEGVIALKVPLKVDVESGVNWLEMEEVSIKDG